MDREKKKEESKEEDKNTTEEEKVCDEDESENRYKKIEDTKDKDPEVIHRESCIF